MKSPLSYPVSFYVQTFYGVSLSRQCFLRTILIFLMIVTSNEFFAQTCTPVWEENFNYTTCTSTNSFHSSNPNWVRYSGSSNDFRYNATGGLNYNGYASSGIGGAAEFRSGSNDDVSREITTIPSSGNLYASFLINMINANNAENFISFRDNSSTPVLYGKIFMRKSGTQFQLGITKTGGTSAVVWSPTLLNFSTTYLIVAKNEFVAGTANDVFKLWIVSSGVPASEATAGTPIQATAETDPQNGIRHFALRQTGNEVGFVDGIRIATTWTDAVCSATTASATYVTPTSTAANTYYINDVKFQGINAVQNLASSYSTSPAGYQDWTSHTKTVQAQGEPINISLAANVQVRWRAWIDWDKNGSFNTTTEEVYSNGTFVGQFAEFGFVIPAGTAPGDYRIRFRASYVNSFGPCENIANGEAEDYLFTVIPTCSAIITAITNGETCGAGTVNLSVTASGNPTQYRWYTNETGGSPIATTTTPNWTTPSINTTTTYYVSAFNGCESINRTPIVATVSPLPTLVFNNPNPITCGDTSVTELSVSGDKQLVVLFDEKFNSGLGLFQNINSDTNNSTVDDLTKWTNKVSTHLPTSALWKPAISSGLTGNRFAFATSDISPLAPNNIENSLTLTTGINTTGFLNLTLSLRVFYSRYLNDGNSTLSGTYYRDDLKVEVYNGTTWDTLATYDYDLGIGNKFATLTFNLPSAYLGLTDFKVRIRHYSSSSSNLYFPGGVAVDDVKLYGEKALSTAFKWTSTPTINAYTDATCTVLYNPLTNVASTVYYKATEAQLLNPSFNIVVNAQLSNGCTASDQVIMNNYTKFWTGANSSNWADPNNWSPVGIPNATQCIIVNDADPAIISAPYTGSAKTISIKPIGSLTINSNASLTITDEIIIPDNGTPSNFTDDGKLLIQDNGSLIQITNPAVDVNGNSINNNTGKIEVIRNTKPVYRYDYTYWSSPVEDFKLGNEANNSLSWQTLFDKFLLWDSSAEAWNTILYGNTIMAAAKGYAVRAPQTYAIEGTNGAVPSIYTARLKGKPHNGIIRHPVYGNTGQWNLLGNPYPSAISADAFLNANVDHPGNLTAFKTLVGTLYFWTHNSAMSETGTGTNIYAYNISDYAAYNGTGGTGTTAGSTSGEGIINSTVPNGFIAAGQAFFVKGASNGSALFNNSMRVTGNNNQFFKPGPTEPENNWEIAGKHRLWLNMTGGTRGFNQLLVGYVPNATNDWDILFDGEVFGGNEVTFYTILNGTSLTIQGRALPFNIQDQVPLGYESTTNGTLKISIDHYDGLLAGQDIYLEDKLLNIMHDLKQSDYSFTSTAGKHNNRFVLRYLPLEQLANPNHDSIANGLMLYKDNGVIMVKSQLENLEQVTVYDLLGRIVLDKTRIGRNEFQIHNVVMNEQPLIVKVKLANGQIVNKKVVH